MLGHFNIVHTRVVDKNNQLKNSKTALKTPLESDLT